MGNLELRDSSGLKLITLSFSSLMASPFEYYNENNGNNAEEIDRIFKEVLKFQLKLTDIEVNNYKWQMGEIDKHFQRDRYSILYSGQACSIPKKDGKGYELVSREEFKQLWDRRMNELLQSRSGKYSPTGIELLNCSVFDFVCYASLLKHVLNVDIDQVKQLDDAAVEKFRSNLRNTHQSFIVETTTKMKLIIEFARTYSIDVLYIQQIEQRVVQDPQFDLSLYQKVFHNRNLLLYRKQAFQGIQRDLEWQRANIGYFQWYDEHVYCKLGDILLASVHFTSKYPQNERIAEEMLKKVHELRQSQPALKILMGINSNHFMQESSMYLFPQSLEHPTSSKKRTYMQAQFNKAGIEVHEVKDHLLSTQRLYDCRVMKIDNSPLTKNSFMPCLEHPFGNLIVFGRVSNPF